LVVSRTTSIHGSHPGPGEGRPEKNGRKEFRGPKRAEVEHHGFEIRWLMSLLHEAGLQFVGMS